MLVNFCYFNLNSLDFSRFLVYSESNYLYVYGTFGSFKIKHSSAWYSIQICNNLLFFVDDILSYKLALNNSTFFNRISYLLRSICVGFRVKYRINGLGWRGFYYKNFLLYKLGYSHLIFFFVPFELRTFKVRKKRIKKYHALVGMDGSVLKDTFFFIKGLRIPDIHSMNGLFSRTLVIEFKEGRKSFML